MVQPLTATFAADFSNFKDAVSRAEDSLKAFGLGANNVEKALTTMGNSLSGQKIVQQATVAAESIELLRGGIASLSDKELARLGKTADEAIQKLERMGKEIPPGIQNISNAAKDAQANTSLLGTISDFIGPKLAAAFSVGAITAWIAKTVEAGSKIEDMSRKLEVSTEAVQRWGFAAELSGGSIEDVSTAIAFMNKTLGGGSDSTVAALQRAGLSFDAIRAMSPEDAFDAITDAIKNIPDPMDQARVATVLFGKGVAVLLPAMRDGFSDVGKQAAVMSSDMIAALDEAGDTWTRFQNQFVVGSARILAAAEELQHPLETLIGELSKIHDTVSDKLVTSIPKLTGVFGALPPAAKPAASALEEFNKVFDPIEQKRKEDATKAIEEHTKKIQALADTLTGRDVAGKARDLGEAIKLAGGASKLTAAQTDLFFKAADALVKGPLGASALPSNVRKFWEENGRLALGIDQELNPSLDRFYDHLYGIDQKLPQLKGNITTFLKGTSVNIRAAWEADEAAGKRAATETERAHKESLNAIEERHNEFVQTVTGYGVTLIDSLRGGWDGFKSAAMSVLDDIIAYFEKVFVVKILEQFGLVQLGGTSAFGQIASASTSIGTASGTAATASTAAWTASFAATAATAISWGATAYLAWQWYRTLVAPHVTTPPTTPPPPNIAPVTNPGGGGDGGGGSDSEWAQGLAYAQTLFDQATATGWAYGSDAFYSWMNAHPEYWGRGIGFREGTKGQYLDFGAGTPVMLHGKERVMTEAEGRSTSGGWGGGVTVVVQTLDGADTESWLRRGGARDIADALGPHLARVLA